MCVLEQKVQEGRRGAREAHSPPPLFLEQVRNAEVYHALSPHRYSNALHESLLHILQT